MPRKLSDEVVKQRTEWRARGLCPRCGEKPAPPSRVWCRGHTNQTYNKKSAAKKCPKCRIGEEKPILEGHLRCAEHVAKASIVSKRHKENNAEHVEAKRREYVRGRGRFNVASRTAKYRGLEWDIPEETYRKLLTQPCHYCKGPLCATGTGLDRKISSKGYLLWNVVPCCGNCNRIKSDEWSYEEMVVIGALLEKIKRGRRINYERSLRSEMSGGMRHPIYL